MTPSSKLEEFIKEAMERFDEKFDYVFFIELAKGVGWDTPHINQLKGFLSSEISNAVNKTVKEIKGMKKEPNWKIGILRPDIDTAWYIKTYNSAIDDVISTLKENQ